MDRKKDKKLNHVSGGASVTDYGIDMSYNNNFIDDSKRNTFKINLAPGKKLTAGEQVSMVNNHQDITTTNSLQESTTTNTNIQVNLF